MAVISPLERLAAAPRVELGHWPTPLQPCPRLRAAIGGPLVWLKRDDCSGLAGGGNKTRKLEFLLGDALAAGADGVVTFGALQSNHARQTAAACATQGLTCDLILTRAVDLDDDHYLRSGNLLLDRLFGATVHEVDDAEAAAARTAELVAAAEADGRRLYVIRAGGSDRIGALGYVDAAVELAGQIGEHGLAVDRLVVATSTAGTAAGLAVGAALAGIDAVLDIVCVYHSAPETAADLDRLIAATADLLGTDPPDPARRTVDDAALGDGYGVPTSGGLAAMELLARTEGVLVDPVYTSKALAHLLGRIERGEVAGERDVVFLHTGGSQGLFAYTPSLDAHLLGC